MAERILSSLIAASLLGLGILVFIQHPKAPANRSFATTCLWASAWIVVNFWESEPVPPAMADLFLRLDFAAAVFAFLAFLSFSLNFPNPTPGSVPLRRALFVPSAALAGFSFSKLIVKDVSDYQPGLQLQFEQGPLFGVYAAFMVGVLLATYFVLFRRWKASRGVERNRLAYVFFGITSATVIAAFINLVLAPTMALPTSVSRIGGYGGLLLAGAVAIAIVKHRLMDINLAITRTAVFLVVYAAILGLPLLGALPLQGALENSLGRRWWVWLLLIYATLATAAHYVNQHFQRRAEERLLAEQRRYQAILRQASQNMTLIKELDKLLSRTIALLTKEVGLSHVAIYLWDQRAKKYVPKKSHRWKVSAPPTFTFQDALLRYFDFSTSPAVTEELQLQARGSSRPSTDLHDVVASLRAMRAAVVVPSFVEKRCIGFLVLGEKKSGTIYTPDDLVVFQVLANQAALAVENAIFYEELKRAQTDLFQTAKMADLGRMAGGMSHQVNNRFHVLTILAGVLNGLFKDLGPDPRQADPARLDAFLKKIGETLPKMEDNALRGGEIVKTLLRFSRPSGDFKPVVLADAVSSALDVVQHRVDLTQFQVHHELPKDLPHVNGDLTLLADCFFNLISNAYDATRKKAELIVQGHLPVQAEDPAPYHGWQVLRASVEEEEGKKWVVLRVKDNGVGMTPEELECLFLPFFTTKATAEKGTGLGLYVIQRIIERHNGTVSAASQYGIGTTFTIRLPAYAGASESPAPQEAPAPQEKPNA